MKTDLCTSWVALFEETLASQTGPDIAVIFTAG